MRYAGSKERIADRIHTAIRENTPDGVDTYVEPFVGGCGSMCKAEYPNRIGADSNEYMVAFWQAIQSGWVPPEAIGRDLYDSLKANPQDHPKELVGFAGSGVSFGGKWFGGHLKTSASDASRNYAAESSRSAVRQAARIIGVHFVHSDYSELEIPSGSIVYCDPPYADTIRYKEEFHSQAFWRWAKAKAKADAGCYVFVSEYSAPDFARCILEIQHKTTMDRNTASTRIEKLYALSLAGAKS